MKFEHSAGGSAHLGEMGLNGRLCSGARAMLTYIALWKFERKQWNVNDPSLFLEFTSAERLTSNACGPLSIANPTTSTA